MRYLLALSFLIATPLSACLWDYDTLAMESEGQPDVKAAIVGGFPRNPPLYYEMRLERVTDLIADNPDDLDAYDAAGVACDRLGRSDEAIEWMERKHAAMERMGYDAEQHEQPNHRYRYLANLGTFYAHRWFKNGADRNDMADMKRGRDLIAQAIEENPDAHFGREKYQLMAMDWALTPPDEEIHEHNAFDNSLLGEHNFIEIVGFSDDDYDEALKGLVGLITMGAAWESVDVLNALRQVLSGQRKASFAYFAELRVRELVEAGSRSVHWPPSLNVEHALEDLETRTVTGKSRTESEYKELGEKADAWHEQRTAYMLTAMKEGRHPDTHANFWEGFDGDPDHMDIPEQGTVSKFYDESRSWFRDNLFYIAGLATLACFALFFVLLPVVVIRKLRRRKRARPMRA